MSNHDIPDSCMSTTETIRLLNDVISNPASFNSQAGLPEALRSQSALAKYTNPRYKIIASSLNTFKRNCALYAPGGFADVDRLRKQAAIALSRASNPEKARRKTQKELISFLQKEISSMGVDLLVLTNLLTRSMNQTRYYACLSTDNSVLALYEKERREIIDMLTCVDSDQWRSLHEKAL